VWRRVFIPEHLDDDAVKHAERRHRSTRILLRFGNGRVSAIQSSQLSH